MFRLILAPAVALALAAAVAPPASATPAPPPPVRKHALAVRSANIQPDMIRVNGQNKLITLDSGYARGVYCDLAKAGFNGVTFAWSIEQTSKTSGKLIPRPAATGRAPTPDDGQIRRAIRSAHSCGLTQVIIKEGIWLPNNEWRAHIPGTKKNQRAWTTRLLHLQQIALEEHASELVIGTEMRDSTTTKGDSKRWQGTIKALRKKDPHHKVRLTYAAHWHTELPDFPKGIAKRLDGLTATWYPKPKDGNHLGLSDLYAGMVADRERYFDPAHKRYGAKFTGFGEVGFRSIDWRDYYTSQGPTPRRDDSLQTRQFQAMFKLLPTMPYVTDLMLYRAQAQPDAAGFSWQGKPAASVIRAGIAR